MAVLDRAVAYWKAFDYEGSGDLLDGSGNSHDAQLGSTGGADSNDPLWLDFSTDGVQYLYTPGVAGNTISAPHIAAIRAVCSILP